MKNPKNSLLPCLQRPCRGVASVLGVATLRLDYSFYTTRYGLDQRIEQALGDAASHLGDSSAPDEKEEKKPQVTPWTFQQDNDPEYRWEKNKAYFKRMSEEEGFRRWNGPASPPT